MSVRSRVGEALLALSLRVLGPDYFARELAVQPEPPPEVDDGKLYPVHLSQKAMEMIAAPLALAEQPVTRVKDQPEPLAGSLRARMREARGDY